MAPIERADKEGFIKIGSMDVVVKETEEPIVIENLSQSDMKYL